MKGHSEESELKETTPIDTEQLFNEAKKSEDKESYRLLEKNPGYRIGVGAELLRSDQPSFFFEVAIQLCREYEEVDLSLLEGNLALLKGLKTRGYSLSCQDGNFVSCRKKVTQDNMQAEYSSIKLLVRETES